MCSEKNRNLSTNDKPPSKCGCIKGLVLNGSKRRILFSFILDKFPGYKVFCEPETLLQKKIKKYVFNTITFYLKDDNEKSDFNHKTLTFRLQMIKI